MVNRRVTVLVDPSAIGDGEISPPRIGQVATYAVIFEETDRFADAYPVRGVLEQSPGPPQPVHGDGVDRFAWTGVFRGPGWSADWTGPRPRLGPVELRGVFFASFGALHRHEIRGRVVRVRIVGDYWVAAAAGDRSGGLVRGRQTLREVDAAPQWLADERFDRRPGVREHLVESVLVDLDLDDVPPLRPRPPFLSLQVAAAGDDLWLLDAQLPRVVLRRQTQISVHDYPAPVVESWHETDRARAVHAAESGCWVSGAAGLFWIGADGATARLTDRPVAACATHDGMLLACAAGRWLLVDGDRLRGSVEAPAGTPVDAGWDRGAFVVVVRVPGDQIGGDDVRLVRVTVDGTVTVGELFPTGPRIRGARLLTNPLAVMLRTHPVTDIVAADADLHAGATSVLRQSILGGGMLGRDRIWTVDHPAEDYDHAAGQRWLVTLHDRRTVAPVASGLVGTPTPSLAQDRSGTVWVADGRRLARLGPGFLQTPEPVVLNVE